MPSEITKDVFRLLFSFVRSSFTFITFDPSDSTVPSVSETDMLSSVIPEMFHVRGAFPVFLMVMFFSLSVSPKSMDVGVIAISDLALTGAHDTEIVYEFPNADKVTLTFFVSDNLSRLTVKTMLCVLLAAMLPERGDAVSQALFPMSKAHSVAALP